LIRLIACSGRYILSFSSTTLFFRLTFFVRWWRWTLILFYNFFYLFLSFFLLFTNGLESFGDLSFLIPFLNWTNYIRYHGYQICQNHDSNTGQKAIHYKIYLTLLVSQICKAPQMIAHQYDHTLVENLKFYILLWTERLCMA